MKIAIFGTYPPPIGGTSIHVKRLAELLQKYYDVTVYDTYGKADSNDDKVISIKNYKKFLVKYLFSCNEDIIHVHTHSWNERFILTLIALIKRKKIVFTYHSFRDKFNKLTITEKLAVKFVFAFADYYIVVNNQMKEKLMDWGAKKEKIKLIPTFLLPNSDEGIISEKLMNFRRNHKYVICANASNNNTYNGEDLYGIDLSIDLCAQLNKEYDVGFIFALTKITDKNYFDELNGRIKTLGLEGKFIFINENCSFLPILKISDVFIRPTNTDSFGISVGEALFLRTPAVASDVCKRPEGTILFNNRDLKDLYNKTKNIIDDYDYYINLLKNITVKDYSEEILRFYKALDTI